MMKRICVLVSLGVGLALTCSAVTAASNGSRTKKVVLAVSDDGCFCCLECFLGFKNAVMKVKGVKEVTPSLAEKQATVQYDPNLGSLYDIAVAVKEKGYTVKEVSAKAAAKPNASSS